jgi:hypothetical protein
MWYLFGNPNRAIPSSSLAWFLVLMELIIRVAMVERFSHLSATHRYEIMNNGSNSGHFWRDFEVLEF